MHIPIPIKTDSNFLELSPNKQLQATVKHKFNMNIETHDTPEHKIEEDNDDYIDGASPSTVYNTKKKNSNEMQMEPGQSHQVIKPTKMQIKSRDDQEEGTQNISH